MKRFPIPTAFVTLAAVAAAASPCFARTDSPAKTAGNKPAFMLNDGFSAGQEIDRKSLKLMPDSDDETETLRDFPEDSKDDDAAMTEEQIVESLHDFIDTLQQRMANDATANLEQGKSFMAQFAGKKGVTTTKSGLMYRVLTKGEGRTYDRCSDGEEAIVSVTYEGKTIDGRTFDKAEEPIHMSINQAVPGFVEALKTMPIGAEWEICLPADLAYGEQAVGPIQANATILFTLKLHAIITLPPARHADAPRPGYDSTVSGTGS